MLVRSKCRSIEEVVQHPGPTAAVAGGGQPPGPVAGVRMLMSHTLSTRTRRRTRATVVLIALLAIGTATAAGAHPDVAKWWQYDTLTWRHSWRDFPPYRRADWTWERRH